MDGWPGKAHNEVQLLKIAVLAPVTAGVSRGLRCRRSVRWRASEKLFGKVDDAVMIEVSGCRQHHAPRAVMGAQIGEHRVPSESADDLRPPQYRPPHRLIGESAFLVIVEDDVVGRVVRLADLLQDPRALALELLAVEGRVLKNVGQYVERQRKVLFEYFGIVGCALPRSVGIEMTADGFDLLGDRQGTAPFGSLECHMLEKMRDPIDLGGLVARANIDPNAERDRVDRIHAVGGHPQSVGQGRELRRHALLRSAGSGTPRMSADISRYRAGIVWQHGQALAPF